MSFLRAFFQRFRRERAPLIDPDGEMLKGERLDAVARMGCDTWPEIWTRETETRGPHKPEICGSTPRPATPTPRPATIENFPRIKKTTPGKKAVKNGPRVKKAAPVANVKGK